MTHSLYTKFVLGYLLFGLLGFVLIATFSSHMTHEYLVRERSDAMYDEANLLASTYSDIYQGKTISLDTANPQLEAVSTYLGASAWVLDHKGAVVAETSPASHSGKTIEGFDPTVTGNKSYIIGDFFGMFPGETLSVLAPITGNFNTYGYVVLHMPMERILDSQNQILNIVYITAAIIFFLSLIILLVFTRTVYFPLKKITAGAMEYAGGNLDHTIKVKTNDGRHLKLYVQRAGKDGGIPEILHRQRIPRFPLPPDLHQGLSGSHFRRHHPAGAGGKISGDRDL